MSLPIRYRPEVQADIDEAYAWYENQRTGLGGEFLSAVRDAMGRIGQNPNLYTRVYREARRALTRRFPYNVLYRVEEDRILVLAVQHGRRDPQRWQTRYDFQ